MIICSTSVVSFAQQPSTKELYDTAKSFMHHGDYDNATLVLNRALQQDPNNLDMLKDLALLNYLKRDYSQSIDLCKTLIERPDADEQTFQILGMDYKDIADNEESERLYKHALKKFPSSGVLHNEYGELLATNNKMPDAIVEWEKGIETDPNYSSNYYNAAMYYNKVSNNPFWTMIYGEIFLNLESYTVRTADIKNVVLEAYKKLYTSTDLSKQNNKSPKTSAFQKAVLVTLNSSNSLALEGISSDVLYAIRTRFVLEWFGNKLDEKFPFRLFDQWKLLLNEGLYEAYNQWIFGLAASPAKYQIWSDVHTAQIASFKEFQHGRVFKLKTGQYYQNMH